MADYKIFSSDSHVSELPDLWIERMDKPLRFRAPRIMALERDDKVEDFLIYEGFPPHAVSVGLAAAAGKGDKAEYRVTAVATAKPTQRAGIPRHGLRTKTSTAWEARSSTPGWVFASSGCTMPSSSRSASVCTTNGYPSSAVMTRSA